MGERHIHQLLIKQMDLWLKEKKSEKYNTFKVIKETFAETNSMPQIGNHYPDFYAISNELKEIYIGEAKPADDIQSPRFELQIKDFLKYLEKKKIEKKFLILSTDYRSSAYGYNLITDIIEKIKCKKVNFFTLGYPIGEID